MLDFSKCDLSELLTVVRQAESVISQQPEHSLLTLTDVTDVPLDDKIVSLLKSLTRHNKPFVKSAAIVGIKGLAKVVLQGIQIASGRKFELFDDREKAADWLSTQ